MALEMSWLRLLEWQLGSTIAAAALAMASFFLFAGWGSWWQGQRAQPENALRRWSTAMALAGGVSAGAFAVAQGKWGDVLAGMGAWGGIVFFGLAGLGSFFLGMSFPALACLVVGEASERTGHGGFIYAGELMGGLMGVFLGGLFLPLWLGYGGAVFLICALAVSVSGGVRAFLLRKGKIDSASAAPGEKILQPATKKKKRGSRQSGIQERAAGDKGLLWLLPLSGFLTCGWQIAMVAVLQFYAGFSLWIMTGVFAGALLGLAGGAALAAWWGRRGKAVRLVPILAGAGFCVAVSPWLAQAAWDFLPQLQKWEWAAGWSQVLLSALPVALAAVVPGMVFPSTWGVWRERGASEAKGARPDVSTSLQGSKERKSPLSQISDTSDFSSPSQGEGAVFGRFMLWNKWAAALGALALPWVLIPALGYAGTVWFLSAAYGVAALVVAWRERHLGAAWAWLSLFFGILLSAPGWTWVKSHTGWSIQHPLEPEWQGRVLERISSAYGTIQVIEEESESRRIYLGRTYSLNGTKEALRHQHNQAWIPWVLAEHPERVLHLGFGSGITAAALLQPGVRELQTVEIVPEVVEMARKHFGEWNGAIFSDERAHVVVADGRQVVRWSGKPYDLIVADLFHPARPSSRLLYTREFFTLVRTRLTEKGVFCLWVPVFQMDRVMWEALAENFRKVFPGSVLVRGNFSPRQPLIGLVGWKNPPSSLMAAWQNAMQKIPLAETEPTLFFAQAENFPLAFIAPLDALRLAPSHRVTWEQPWFTLQAASLLEIPGRLRGGRFLNWLEEIGAQWAPSAQEDLLARASRAALRQHDAMLPWTLPTRDVEQMRAKENHTQKELQKAREIYPEGRYYLEGD